MLKILHAAMFDPPNPTHLGNHCHADVRKLQIHKVLGFSFVTIKCISTSWNC